MSYSGAAKRRTPDKLINYASSPIGFIACNGNGAGVRPGAKIDKAKSV